MRDCFLFRMRVRFHECDGQKVVFNSRYGEFVDVAALEFSRALWGAGAVATPGHPPIDWRLVKQEMQWKSPAVFDDILEIEVRTLAVGTTSFTWESRLLHSTGRLLALAKTVYVLFDSAENVKRVISEEMREKLALGAAGVITDCSGTC